MILKKKISALPDSAGVYIFSDSRKKIIYIGKSVSVKKRVSSYFTNKNLGPKTKAMVKDADFVSYIKTTTELESLLLEAKLIGTKKPHYNISLKDDKKPLYIIITKEEFPRVISGRSKSSVSYKQIYGPFPSGRNVKTILKLIRRAIPYSDHVAVSGKIGKKPCFYSHLGLCQPCPNAIVQSTQYLVKSLNCSIFTPKYSYHYYDFRFKNGLARHLGNGKNFCLSGNFFHMVFSNTYYKGG